MLKKSMLRIIQVFSFVLVMFSTFSAKFQSESLYYRISIYFHSGLFHDRFFSPFELIFIALLVNILRQYKVKIKVNNSLFLFAFLAYCLRMLNPNSATNNPILGMPLLSQLSEYLFMLMILVFASLKASQIKELLEAIFKYTLIFSALKAAIILILYFAGKIYVFRWNYAILLPEADTQLLFALLGSVLFTLYLIKVNRLYLFLSAVFFVIIAFSMQRSTTMSGFIAVFAVIVFSIVRRIPLSSGKSIRIIVLILFVVQMTLTHFPQSKTAFILNRHFGVMTDKSKVKEIAFSDTGHREQSQKVFISALKNMSFWGIGYGRINSRLYLEGQTSNIHNNYAILLAQHGPITLLFYMFVFGLIIKQTYRLAIRIDRFNYQKAIVRLSIGFYLMGYFVSAWFNSVNILMIFRFQILLFLLYFYLTMCPDPAMINQTVSRSGKIKNPIKVRSD